LALVLLASMTLPLTGYLFVGQASAQATAQQQDEKATNPRANYWRAVRDGQPGYVAMQSPYATNVLIQNGGQNWLQLRNGPMITYGAVALGLVVLALLAYTVFHGRVKLEGGESGRKVLRWSLFNRMLHWYTAILFIILAITGLSLLFGRTVLIPLLGAEGFANWSQFARLSHDYLGPAFSIGVVLMIVLWLPFNLPEKGDWNWLKQGGGMFGGNKHPHCGRINPGEKLFTYGTLLVLGAIVVVTGFILDFPSYGQTRETMQLANLIHGAASVLWTFFMLGHIYLGAYGVEGSLPAMISGDVDENWARQHHDRWFDKLRG
jgi:formate dehydrogenase subunit gamma